MVITSLSEAVPCALVRVQRQGGVLYHGRLHHKLLEEVQGVVSISFNDVYLLARGGLLSSILITASSSFPDSYSSLLSDVLAAASDMRFNILEMKILMGSSADVYLSSITASVRNGGRSKASSNVQSRSVFDCARSPTAAQRRTSVTGRRFFSDLAKAHLVLMETTVGCSRYTARAKSVIASLG